MLPSYLLLEAEARKAHETIEPGRTYALMERDRPTGRCSMVVGAVHEVPGTGRVWTAVHNFEPTAQGQVTGVDGMVTQGPFSLPTERDSARHRRLFRFLGPIRTHPSVQRQAFSQAGTLETPHAAGHAGLTEKQQRTRSTPCTCAMGETRWRIRPP